MNHMLLAIDQGTTSSRAILFSIDGRIIDIRQKELTLRYPQNGWVEQDANDIWQDCLWAARQVITGHPGSEKAIAGIGITNQRETTIVWNRHTGEPVYNAIVWQDRRTAAQCAALKQQGHETAIAAKTGLLLDPYFSATKIAWILDNVEGARHAAKRGDLAFGTVDCFLLWKLTGGRVHATDATNASRTMLFNIKTQSWDDDLLALFNIPRGLLPDVHDNVHNFGQSAADLLGKSYTIGGMAGDQQAALIGQACFEPGMVKSTYGTGCFALMNIGRDCRLSQSRLLTTQAYRFQGQSHYAIEGSIFVAGAAIQWLRDGLCLFTQAAQSEDLARKVADSNGVYFVPAFTGLGAPYWNPHARAAILGLTRESTAAHITRAALEAQAYQTRDLMDAMEADTGTRPEIIRADGGLVHNGFVCQFIADMLDTPLDIPQITETTAWGAACLAGLQSGIYQGLEDITARWQHARRYTPTMPADRREQLYRGWQTAIRSVIAGNH
ncbi:MAG: glycerol kinase GlpK [Micavibrio aeruginosavorus]|uniref:Glycerol kinase n=1 Tax=Micavibrio aeruginosavorus TaxID=349221 RepID=A0A7T5R3R5_9BACT|nr:MAG: glycerol kinase GlpK [Micavibrio aeruginosavorus]